MQPTEVKRIVSIRGDGAMSTEASLRFPLNEAFSRQRAGAAQLTPSGRGCPWQHNKVIELKKDREVVLAAVQQDGGSLQYAAEELKKDWQVAVHWSTRPRS